jgi:hypothetical protein
MRATSSWSNLVLPPTHLMTGAAEISTSGATRSWRARREREAMKIIVENHDRVAQFFCLISIT